MKKHLIALWISTLLFSTTGYAKPHPLTPESIIKKLMQRMYAIGETNPKYERFQLAQQKAAKLMREFMKTSKEKALFTQKNKQGQTPLMLASYLGYSQIIEVLLESKEVQASINTQKKNGLNAWVYVNLAMRQSLFACNEAISKNPFSFVPLAVTQPFYMQSNAYQKSRELLEKHGAKANIDNAKKIWNTFCSKQSLAVKQAVQNSDDLLQTLVEEGAKSLNSILNKRRKH